MTDRSPIDRIYRPEPKDSVRAAFVGYLWRIWFQWPAVVVYALVAVAYTKGAAGAIPWLLGGYLFLALVAFGEQAADHGR